MCERKSRVWFATKSRCANCLLRHNIDIFVNFMALTIRNKKWMLIKKSYYAYISRYVQIISFNENIESYKEHVPL